MSRRGSEWLAASLPVLMLAGVVWALALTVRTVRGDAVRLERRVEELEGFIEEEGLSLPAPVPSPSADGPIVREMPSPASFVTPAPPAVVRATTPNLAAPSPLPSLAPSPLPSLPDEARPAPTPTCVDLTPLLPDPLCVPGGTP